jgi:phage baseplate assembly protein W
VIVLDASAAIDWLLQTATGQQVEKRIYSRNEFLAAPHLVDLEVTQVLRRLVRSAVVSARRAEEAIHDLMDLRIAISTSFVSPPNLATQEQSLGLRRCVRGARRKPSRYSDYTRSASGF